MLATSIMGINVNQGAPNYVIQLCIRYQRPWVLNVAKYVGEDGGALECPREE